MRIGRRDSLSIAVSQILLALALVDTASFGITAALAAYFDPSRRVSRLDADRARVLARSTPRAASGEEDGGFRHASDRVLRRSGGWWRRSGWCWRGLAPGLSLPARGCCSTLADVAGARAATRDFYHYYIADRIRGFMSHWMTFSGQELYHPAAGRGVSALLPGKRRDCAGSRCSAVRWWWGSRWC